MGVISSLRACLFSRLVYSFRCFQCVICPGSTKAVIAASIGAVWLLFSTPFTFLGLGQISEAGGLRKGQCSSNLYRCHASL